MTKRINMSAGAAAQGGVGVGLMSATGNPWTVADGLADELVNRRIATYADAQAAGLIDAFVNPNTGALVGPDNQALSSVSGASNFQGTRNAPVSTFNGASSSGVVGTPTQLRIPANSLVYGQSRTELEFVLRKVGGGVGFVAVNFGPIGGIGDTLVSPATGNGFSTADPQEFEYRILLSYSASRIYARWTRFFATGSFVTDGLETTLTIDPTVDNFVSVVLSGMSAGTTVALVALRYQHFR